MIPGTTMIGITLFEGLSTKPRIRKFLGVATECTTHSPLGRGSNGGKNLVGSAMAPDCSVQTSAGKKSETWTRKIAIVAQQRVRTVEPKQTTVALA
jgi:hypothetical protein